jgi:hypothetical protein
MLAVLLDTEVVDVAVTDFDAEFKDFDTGVECVEEV